MIGVLDYGIGNVAAIIRSFSIIGVEAEPVRRAEDCENFPGLVLPGVGSFDMVMGRLDSLGFREALDETVRVKGTPILGICVGMQVMCKASEEGSLRGFGWVDATVERMDSEPLSANENLTLPHMGWNYAEPRETESSFGEGGTDYYFLHSYAVRKFESSGNVLLSSYGGQFISGFEVSNISAVQFHPEKSHGSGLRLLEGFSRKIRNA